MEEKKRSKIMHVIKSKKMSKMLMALALALAVGILLGISTLARSGDAAPNSQAIAAPPVITAHPTHITVNQHEKATLTVVASGSGTLSYQWYARNLNGNGSYAIYGATSASYDAPTNVVGLRAHFCRVTNTDETATGITSASTNSSSAWVTVKNEAGKFWMDITDSFKDPVFLAVVRKRTGIYDKPIYNYDLLGIVNLSIFNENITDLSGIEYFSDLKHLNCPSNKLTELDLSKNISLVTVNCSNNQLTSLDLPENTTLELLYCYNNQLTSLDVSKNTLLKILDCRHNYMPDPSAVIGVPISKWDNASFAFYPQDAISDILPGDINGDRVVSRADQTRLNQFLSGVDPSMSSFVDVNADVNGDGILTRADQTRLNQFFSGMDSSPLGGKPAPIAASMFSISAFSADAPSLGDNGAYVGVSGATGGTGDEIILTVSLENNPGITGYGVTMYYDDAKLTYISSAAGDILPTMFNATQAFLPITDNRYITFSSADFAGGVDTGRVLFSVKLKVKGGLSGAAISSDDLKFGYFHKYDDFALSATQVMQFDIEQWEVPALPEPHTVPITSIQIDAPPTTTVVRGGSYSFRATLNEGALSGGIVWSVSNPLYATVDNNGAVTILNKTGTVILTAKDPDSGLSHSIVLRIV